MGGVNSSTLYRDVTTLSVTKPRVYVDLVPAGVQSFSTTGVSHVQADFRKSRIQSGVYVGWLVRSGRGNSSISTGIDRRRV